MDWNEKPTTGDNTRPRRWRLRNRTHSVRIRTLLIILATIVALLAILYIPLRIILLGNFTDLEKQTTSQNVQRALNALSDDIATLNRTTRDYAAWDDTYAFIENANRTYIEQNLGDQTFTSNRLSLALFVNTAGKVVFGKAFDLAASRERPIPPRLQAFASPDDALLRHASIESSTTGILVLPEGPLLVAARPILTSAYTGPIRGTLIMGRFLDSAEVQQLAQTTRLSLSVHMLADQQLPPDVRATQARLSPGSPIAVQPMNEQAIAGYALLQDLAGGAGLVLRVETARDVYLRGRASTFSFSLAFLAAGVVFGAVMLLLLERLVLSRLARLSASVSKIGANGGALARVAIDGSDEFAQLGDTINAMLEAIEHAESERRTVEEASARAKSEFISAVSHELRTPLTPMRGYVDLLMLGEGGSLTADQRQFLQIIKTNLLRMSALVEDLLEIGRMDSGKVTLNYSPVELDRLIAEVVLLLQPELRRKEMVLVQEISDTLPPLMADGKRIGQVLTNLVSNAIKYTYPEGTIWIRAFMRDEEHAEIQVEDTGVGLTAEQQQKLFVPFYRADNPLRDQVSGTGLGLAIAKAFVELHGGELSVRSEVNIGSVFAVTLPIRQVPSDQPMPLEAQVN